MSNDNIETMKAELIEAGYEYHPEYKTVYGNYDNAYILCPDGIKILIENSIDDEAETGLAHTHMLKERELADLRARVTDYEAFVLLVESAASRPFLYKEARELREKYNITENDDNESDDGS